MEVFVDIIAADGAYVRCERPQEMTVGVGQVVPAACRLAMKIDRAVEDRMAVYHVEETRFLEWPGFTETAVRNRDTLIVVAAADAGVASATRLERLWLEAGGLERRTRAENRPGPPQAGGPLVTRALNQHVVPRSKPRVRRPTRNGMTATDLVLQALREHPSRGERRRAQRVAPVFEDRLWAGSPDTAVDDILIDLPGTRRDDTLVDSEPAPVRAVGSGPQRAPTNLRPRRAGSALARAATELAGEPPARLGRR